MRDLIFFLDRMTASLLMSSHEAKESPALQKLYPLDHVEALGRNENVEVLIHPIRMIGTDLLNVSLVTDPVKL